MHSYRITAHRDRRYTNPNYVHPIELTPMLTDDKAEVMLRYVELGNYSRRDIAQMFNVDGSTVNEWVNKAGYSWREERNTAQLRLARTVETMHEWGDVDYAELSEWLNVPYTTMKGWRNEITQPIPERPHFQR
jgi:DNA-directed RNA polymerase specialized sigma24 family protein